MYAKGNLKVRLNMLDNILLINALSPSMLCIITYCTKCPNTLLYRYVQACDISICYTSRSMLYIEGKDTSCNFSFLTWPEIYGRARSWLLRALIIGTRVPTCCGPEMCYYLTAWRILRERAFYKRNITGAFTSLWSGRMLWSVQGPEDFCLVQVEKLSL